MIPKHDEDFSLQTELKKVNHLLDLFTANVDEDLQYKKHLIYDAKENLKHILEKTNVS